MVTMSISGDLISDVRMSLYRALGYSLTGKGVRRNGNAYAPNVFSAYVTSVAAVEAFINEACLGHMCRAIYGKSALWDLHQDSLERMDLLLKAVIVPQLLFGVTFRRNEQPFQDFALLCKVRNDIVHFKMQFAQPKYIDALAQRGIALTTGEPADYPWPAKISCTEGIRWAHNTACRTAIQLIEFIPEEHRSAIGSWVASFSVIESAEIEQWYSAHGGSAHA